MVSLDGFFEGSNKWEIDWHVVGEEFNETAIAWLKSYDALIFGRVTYLGMASYWPTPEAIKNDPIVARGMNAATKVVFSRTLKRADWKNTRLVNRDAAEEVAALKRQPGKDMVIYGSGDIVSVLAREGLIDDYRIFIAPIALGAGKPMFRDVNRLPLKLLDTRKFGRGVVGLHYQPEQHTP